MGFSNALFFENVVAELEQAEIKFSIKNQNQIWYPLTEEADVVRIYDNEFDQLPARFVIFEERMYLKFIDSLESEKVSYELDKNLAEGYVVLVQKSMRDRASKIFNRAKGNE